MTKRKTYEELIEEGKEIMKARVLESLDDYIDTQRKQRELYPRNTKFIDLEIETLEEFRETLIENLKYDVSNTYHHE